MLLVITVDLFQWHLGLLLIVLHSKVFGLSGAAVLASMLAYLIAQYIDIRISFLKNLLMENIYGYEIMLTIFSQFVDTFSVLFLLCSFDVIA